MEWAACERLEGCLAAMETALAAPVIPHTSSGQLLALLTCSGVNVHSAYVALCPTLSLCHSVPIALYHLWSYLPRSHTPMALRNPDAQSLL